MAYVLGYFTADGYMFVNPGNSYYIAFVSTDYELISKVQEILSSKHKIGIGEYKNQSGKVCYRLQIGGKEIFQDLFKFGLTPNKSKTIKLPQIPKIYFRHFLRGYFDGDGCVSFGFYRKTGRKKSTFILNVRFTSGSRDFLRNLFRRCKEESDISGGCLYQRQRGYELTFSTKDSLKFYKFMYKNIKNNLFLQRKYNIFQKALKCYAGVA